MKLNALKNNECCLINKLQMDKTVQRHLFDMGLIIGRRVKVHRQANKASGGLYEVSGVLLGLSNDLTKNIIVNKL